MKFEKGLSAKERANKEREWTEEQARQKIRFEEAQKAVKLIEARETRQSSQQNTTEVEIRQTMQAKADERRKEMESRREEKKQEAAEEKELRACLKNTLGELSASLVKMEEREDKLIHLMELYLQNKMKK